MARKVNLQKLIERFLAETDNSKAFDHLDKLLKQNKLNPDRAVVNALRDFLTLGNAQPIRFYVVARLADLEQHEIIHLEKDFQAGLRDDTIRYWSILAYSKCAGAQSFPDLVAIALDEKLKSEERAQAIQCMASISKMPFDEGMPKNPGHWNMKKFAVQQIIDWQNSGYPQGAGAVRPERAPALDDPKTPFEITMSEFDLKLKRFRDADTNNSTNPSNYLTYGNVDAIEKVCKRWSLPSNYVDFLKRFFPYRLNCAPTLKQDHVVEFCRPEDLIEEQENWSHCKDGKPREFWKPEYFIIGYACGPVMLDLSLSNGKDAPVLSYDYCLELGECDKEATSFEALIKKLKV